MTDREKVIKGIQQCWLPRDSEEIETQCVDCPYYYPDGTLDDCMGELRADAVALLKAQPDIVRCKDCTYYLPLVHSCQHLPATVANPNGFCSDGERREEQHG